MLNLRNLSNACALKERDRRLTWCRIVRSNVMFFNHPAILYVCEEKNVPYTMNTIRLNLVFVLIVNNGHWFQHQCGKRVVIHEKNRYILNCKHIPIQHFGKGADFESFIFIYLLEFVLEVWVLGSDVFFNRYYWFNHVCYVLSTSLLIISKGHWHIHGHSDQVHFIIPIILKIYSNHSKLISFHFPFNPLLQMMKLELFMNIKNTCDQDNWRLYNVEDYIED